MNGGGKSVLYVQKILMRSLALKSGPRNGVIAGEGCGFVKNAKYQRISVSHWERCRAEGVFDGGEN